MEKKTKRCHCCNAEVPFDTLICPKCGASLPQHIDPKDYKTAKKGQRLCALVGVSVGIISVAIFMSINPNNLYLLFISLALGFGSAYLTATIWDKYHENKTKENGDENIKESDTDKQISSREERWRERKKMENEILYNGSSISNQTLGAAEALNALWDAHTYSYKEKDDPKFRAEIYVRALTPKVFLNKYYILKKGDHDEIKDNIYTDYPYLVLETLINMGVYIFKTNMQLYALQFIIDNGEEEFTACRDKAREILERESSPANT